MSHDETVAFIVAARGTHFDPVIVDAFVQAAPALRDLSAD
jgi:response regulator RpfG family c-di-GMP phosphodiesterase